MSALTKSLHTVTAVSRVAHHLATTKPRTTDPELAVRSALLVLGYDGDYPANDPTILAAINATRKLLS